MTESASQGTQLPPPPNSALHQTAADSVLANRVSSAKACFVLVFCCACVVRLSSHLHHVKHYLQSPTAKERLHHRASAQGGRYEDGVLWRISGETLFVHSTCVIDVFFFIILFLSVVL